MKLLTFDREIKEKSELLDIKITDNYLFAHHLGILLVFSAIAKMKLHIPFATQWLVTVLLGAKNIEQTKILDFASLKMLFPEFNKDLSYQRESLAKCASAENYRRLLKYNGELLNVENETLFYYDPHTEPYLGMRKILKSWSGGTGQVKKVINMDFIHTAKGFPLYLKHDDTYYDLRERYPKYLKDFRELFGINEDKIITFVIDRGIYKEDLFRENLKTKNKIITWEKNYTKGEFKKAKQTGEFAIKKCRNKDDDFKIYNFKYIDKKWEKIEEMRQLIVLATSPKGDSIEVSIITDNKTMASEEVIEAIMSRWLQENDFKYLGKHFGINEITSYDYKNYQEVSKNIEDKETLTGEIISLRKKKSEITKKLKSSLLSEKTSKNKNKKRSENIEKLSEELEKIKSEMKETEEKESKSAKLTREDYKKLNTSKKAVMDSIKIIARNIFYQLFDPFKKEYNNYRDDHVIFRNLLHSHGMIKFSQGKIKVLLCPTIQYPQKTKEIIQNFLHQTNKNNVTNNGGFGRKFEFELIKPEDIQSSYQRYKQQTIFDI